MSGEPAVINESARIAEAIPDYDVDRELGRGGMGVVYLGRHRRLERGVAIKELPPSFAAEPEVRERFSAEARTLATLAHPHIVPIFDYVEREGLCLIVMEELPGGTVWDRFTTTGLTPPAACAVVMACCAALQHAHSKGVLHLDVKPDNLMFDAASAVKVTDFGIARVISGDRTMGTVDGQVLGTPAYMSPEQARGDELTPASDVYAAGVMLYELLSGQLPWQGAESAAQLLAQRLQEDPIPLGSVAAHVPPLLAAVVMTALSRDVSLRYQRAEDLGVAIGEACADSWGPDWLDHAGIAIVGSERLSRAARTTSHVGVLNERPTPTTSTQTAGSGAAPATGDVTPASTATPLDTGSTVVTGRADAAVAGAAETAPVASATAPLERARETQAAGTAPAAPASARETTVAGTAPAAPPSARETTIGGRGPDSTPPARETIVRSAAPTGERPSAATLGAAPVSAAGGAGPAPATVGPSGPGAPPAFEVVRPDGAEPRIEGANLYELELADLIGVEDVLDPPRSPARAVLLTAGLFLSAVAAAVAGIGAPSHDSGLPAGQVEIGGVDVAAGERIALDLSEEVTVRVDDSLASAVDVVELELGYAGLPVATSSALLRDGEATLDPGIAQRTVGGAASGTLRLLDETAVEAEHEISVDATQTRYLTAPFVVGVLVLLLALANLEGSLRPLRSGRRRLLSTLGAFVWGALGGAGLVLVAGALGLSEPTIPATIVTALLGALAGMASATARIGLARRARVQRAVRRAAVTHSVHMGDT